MGLTAAESPQPQLGICPWHERAYIMTLTEIAIAACKEILGSANLVYSNVRGYKMAEWQTRCDICLNPTTIMVPASEVGLTADPEKVCDNCRI